MKRKIMLVDPKYNRHKAAREFTDGIATLLDFNGYKTQIRTDLEFMLDEKVDGLFVHASPFEIKDVGQKLLAYQAAFPENPIIITSGYYTEGTRNKSFLDHGFHVLIQPYEFDEVLKIFDGNKR